MNAASEEVEKLNKADPRDQDIKAQRKRRSRGKEARLADLETLISTGPVGIIVFDAGTGETVRAEPIVIQVPDVGSVTTLVSATPIRSEAGEVESVVVTLQDLTPLEELEGQRAEAAEIDVTIPAVEGAATVPPRSPASPRQEAREETRILVVDDDPRARRYARDALSEAGYESIATAGPEAALPLMEAHRPDLVLLDLMGPGGGGLELMRDILGRADGPVIFLSGDDPGEVIARAFEAGAADYIVKPFSPIELVARLGAALRRPAPRPAEPTQPYVLGPLTVDYGQRLVTLADRPVALTAAEYELLFELSIHAGGVVTHNQLLRRLWGPTHSGDMRLLRTLVRRLRRKLADDATSPTYLFAEPRVGYRMPKPQPEPGTA